MHHSERKKSTLYCTKIGIKKKTIAERKWRNLRVKGKIERAHENLTDTLTEVFLNQKRKNVCERRAKMKPPDSFTYIYFVIEKDLCESRNVLSFCLLSWFTFAFLPETSSFFSVRVSLFISTFVLSVFRYFPFIRDHIFINFL